jgi:hypothetical protein
MFTPVPLGGLAFPPLRISWFIMLGGITQSLWLLLAMPPLDKRLGTYRLTRLCFAVRHPCRPADVSCNRDR